MPRLRVRRQGRIRAGATSRATGGFGVGIGEGAQRRARVSGCRALGVPSPVPAYQCVGQVLDPLVGMAVSVESCGLREF